MPSQEKIGVREPFTFVVRTGESATITASVSNDGGQEGSYIATLKINGQTQDAKEIALHPGQSQEVVFSVIENEPGHYVVQIDNLSGEFQTLVWTNWWLIAGLATAFGLLVWAIWYLVYCRRRRYNSGG